MFIKYIFTQRQSFFFWSIVEADHNIKFGHPRYMAYKNIYCIKV
jgi:hypothetical protein